MSRFQLPDPALWVVKMVQGAVAARCFGVEFLFDRHEIRCRVYGPPIPNALDLLKVLLGGDSPKERYIHHWLVALRSLFGRELAEWNWSSEIEGEREEVRLIDGEPVCRSSSCEHELDTLTISLKTPASRTPVSLSHAEYKYLCSLCALCPIPVTADGRLISQQHPACLIRADYAAIWMEGARVEQASFPLHTTNPHPKQMKPVLIARKPLPDGDEIRPCSRIVIVAPTRRQSPAGTEVFWLRDGALLGLSLIHISEPTRPY